MKTNKLIILINELEEHQMGSMPGLDHPCVTARDLVALNQSDSVQVLFEDVFVSEYAKWPAIKERIEEYLQLSFLREGRLEIVYFSIYDILTRLYTHDADQYFHFYDDCIKREEIEELVHAFPSTFPCRFVNRSNDGANAVLIENETHSNSHVMRSFHKYLTISSAQQYMHCA